jgi:hypothetical protein
MKNSSDSIENRTRELPVWSATPYPSTTCNGYNYLIFIYIECFVVFVKRVMDVLPVFTMHSARYVSQSIHVTVRTHLTDFEVNNFLLLTLMTCSFPGLTPSG